MKEKRGLALLAAWACVAIWGATFISTKILLQGMGPIGILLTRTALGTAALYIVCRGRFPLQSLRTEMLMAAAGLAGVCLYYVLENLALVYTSASNVSVIVSVAPLLTGLLAWRFLSGERPRWNFYAGFAAAIAGIWLVSSGPTEDSSGIAGDILSLLAALCWAIYSVLVRKIGELGLSVTLVTRRIFVYGLAFLIICFLFSGEDIDIEVFTSLADVGNLLFLGIGASAFCFFAWNYAVDTLGAVQTAVYIYAVPIITVVLAATILGEKLNAPSIAGVALTVAGMVIAQWARRMPPSTTRAGS